MSISNGEEGLIMFAIYSCSKKYDYEIYLMLNLVIFLTLLKNVATLQTTLNIHNSFSDLTSNQLTNQLANQFTTQITNQLNNQSFVQTDLDHIHNTIKQNLLNNDHHHHQFKKESNGQVSNQDIILPNFQDQPNIWSLQMDKPSNQNILDYSNSPTLLPPSPLNPSLSSSFINSQTISNSLNSIHSSSPSSIPSLSSQLQLPRPLNENENNFSPSFSGESNSIYNENNQSPNLNANSNNVKNANNFNNLETNQQSHQADTHFKKTSSSSNIDSLNNMNHNLFGGDTFTSFGNLPSTTELRANTGVNILNFKKKNAFQAAQKNYRSKDTKNNNMAETLPNFLVATTTNNRHIPTVNNWQQIGSQLNSKLDTISNENIFKTEYPANKFIPNRMQTDDYDESSDDELKNNNANMNANNFQSSNQNESGDEDNFSDAFNTNNELDTPITNTNNKSTKKKTKTNVDPINLLLYNKFNQLGPSTDDSTVSAGHALGKKNSNIPISNPNLNQPFYVILPQIPTNPLDELFDSGIESNPPLPQKRRKSTQKSANNNKVSWWHRLLPERLRPQTNTHATSSENTSSEENVSNESSRYKDTKFKNSYLKAPESNSLFTEVYGTSLQSNVPLSVFQPVNTAQLLSSLPYGQDGSNSANYHPNAGLFGLPSSSGTSLFGQQNLAETNEPTDEEAAAEEDAEEEENHNNQTFGDRMKNWFKNIFGKSSSNGNSNNQHEGRKSSTKLSPKIFKNI